MEDGDRAGICGSFSRMVRVRRTERPATDGSPAEMVDCVLAEMADCAPAEIVDCALAEIAREKEQRNRMGVFMSGFQ